MNDTQQQPTQHVVHPDPPPAPPPPPPTPDQLPRVIKEGQIPKKPK